MYIPQYCDFQRVTLRFPMINVAIVLFNGTVSFNGIAQIIPTGQSVSDPSQCKYLFLVSRYLACVWLWLDGIYQDTPRK